jgi:hypothetical protein
VPRRPGRTANRNGTRAPDYRVATKLRRRMRRRVRSRVLRSVRTATRNFDLELAIATLRLHTQLYVEIDDSGSVWRQQGGTFRVSVPKQEPSSARHCTGDKPALSQSPVFPESLIVAIIDSSLF